MNIGIIIHRNHFLDKYRNIYNVLIKKDYYNNYGIFKQKYINELIPPT